MGHCGQPLEPLPLLTEYNEDEKRIAELQIGFATRLRQSAYYIIEQTKSTGKRLRSGNVDTPTHQIRSVDLPRYSDKYRPSPATQPTLKRKDLHQPFFPQEIFEDYFNPKRRKTGAFFVARIIYSTDL